MPPTDPKIVYDWFEVGVLDYDFEEKLYLVQKVNRDNRVLDTQGNPVVNGGIQSDGRQLGQSRNPDKRDKQG